MSYVLKYISIYVDLLDALTFFIYFFSKVLEEGLKSLVNKFLDSKMNIIPFLLPRARHVKSLKMYIQEIDNYGFPNEPNNMDFLHSTSLSFYLFL